MKRNDRLAPMVVVSLSKRGVAANQTGDVSQRCKMDVTFSPNILLLTELQRGEHTMIRRATTVEETQPTRSRVSRPLISAGEVANKQNTWRERLLTRHREDVLHGEILAYL